MTEIRWEQYPLVARHERVVGYGTVTSRLLEAYLRHRRTLSLKAGPLFVSESHRNTAGALSLVMWSKVVQKIAGRTGLPRFTTYAVAPDRSWGTPQACVDVPDAESQAEVARLKLPGTDMVG
jgi:hypothetical protein